MNSFSEESFRSVAESDGITHISTGIAIVRDKKVLIVKRAATDYLGGQYELPGGGVDECESIIDSAVREVKEETGLKVSKVLSVFDGFDYKTDRKPNVRQINFLVQVESGEVVLNPEEHDEFQWADSDTDLNGLMSADMKTCVDEAIRLANQAHLYLITLEVDPLIVGGLYNPLPSHLTLVSRFWSKDMPDKISDAVTPIFRQLKPIELIFANEAVIGPKKTAVHLIENTVQLKKLHLQLIEVLTRLNVSFTAPQFIREGHKPHVSKRPDVHFSVGHKQVAKNAYLIEVEITGNEHLRKIYAKFPLGS